MAGCRGPGCESVSHGWRVCCEAILENVLSLDCVQLLLEKSTSFWPVVFDEQSFPRTYFAALLGLGGSRENGSPRGSVCFPLGRFRAFTHV